jgi:hypothetical protein
MTENQLDQLYGFLFGCLALVCFTALAVTLTLLGESTSLRDLFALIGAFLGGISLKGLWKK